MFSSKLFRLMLILQIRQNRPILFHDQAGDLMRCFDIAERIVVFHTRTLRLQDMTVKTGLI